MVNLSRFKRMERIIRTFAIVFLTVLITVQLLMQIESVRKVLSRVEKYEGEPYINYSVDEDGDVE